MRYPIMLSTIMLVMLFGIGKPSASALDNPRGSYQSSCKNIKVRGDVLYARCKDYNNHWVDSSLNDYDRCGGDISNANGQLSCGGQGGGSYGAPAGDYTQTCRDISVRGNTLRARCQTGSGDWVDTYLDSYDRCRNGISNVNGQLRCNGGGGDGDRDGDRDRYRAPRGSYQQSCRDIRVRGDRLEAECDTGNGDWRRSSLDHFDDCNGEIVNDSGQLECTRRGGRQVPRGSYVSTCRNIYVRGDTLRASCQTGDGHWNWSQLDDWDDCRGGIVNNNGHLVCRKDRDRD